MELYSISATSLEVAELCMARWAAEKIDRVPRTGDMAAADSGTVLHAVLETYVPAVYKDKTHDASLEWLIELFDQEFPKLFGSLDKKNQWYQDGLGQLKNWFKRTDLSSADIVSTEVKSFIMIKTSQGPKKYNYIWDRCDRLVVGGKKIIKVVDYKSWRKNLTTDEMRTKIQFRMYAMAAMIQFKDEDFDEIWVEADQLRWGTVSVPFTRDECVATWKFVKELAEKIITTEREKVVPTLNPDCQYCPIKLTCGELTRNIKGGGAFSLDDPALARKKYELEAQLKAAKAALSEVDELIGVKARNEDILEWEADDDYSVVFKPGRGQRVLNDRVVADILGPELFRTVGKVTLKTIDDLIANGEVTEEQAKEIKDSMTYKTGEFRPTVVKKNGIKKADDKNKSNGLVAL